MWNHNPIYFPLSLRLRWRKPRTRWERPWLSAKPWQDINLYAGRDSQPLILFAGAAGGNIKSGWHCFISGNVEFLIDKWPNVYHHMKLWPKYYLFLKLSRLLLVYDLIFAPRYKFRHCSHTMLLFCLSLQQKYNQDSLKMASTMILSLHQPLWHQSSQLDHWYDCN